MDLHNMRQIYTEELVTGVEICMNDGRRWISVVEGYGQGAWMGPFGSSYMTMNCFSDDAKGNITTLAGHP